MKNFLITSIIAILLIFIPFFGFSQWAYHHYFQIDLIAPDCSGTFKDAVFISADTGFYCYSQYCSPSLTESMLKRTVDNCSSWQIAKSESGMGCSARAVKFFPPYVYYLRNWQGFLIIMYSYMGSGWIQLPWTPGVFYRDFYANSPSDYKVIYSNGNFAHYLNDTIVLLQPFPDYTVQKMHFPIDTVGFFIAKPLSGSNNSLIVKYTPTSGFNIVYENSSENFKALDFSDNLTAYICSNNGKIVYSNDLGQSWHTIFTGASSQLMSIDFVSDSIGYTVGTGGTILRTQDKGETWVLQETPYSGTFDKVFFTDQETGFILRGKILFKTLNGGLTWIKNESMSNNQLLAYPNPGSGDIKILLPEGFDLSSQYQLTISDASGKVIFSQYNEMIDNPFRLQSDIPPGWYIVSLTSDQKHFNTKLVIK